MVLRVDILWAKHVLPPDLAGLYGFMSLIASVLYMGTTGVERTAISYLTERSAARIEVWTASIIILAACAGAGVFFLVADWLVPVFAPSMPPIDSLALIFLFAGMTCYCLIHWFFQCLSILHRNIHVVLSGSLLCCQALLFIVFGDAIRSIAAGPAIAMMLFVRCFAFALRHLSRCRSA